jgi:hypothetical protein
MELKLVAANALQTVCAGQETFRLLSQTGYAPDQFGQRDG